MIDPFRALAVSIFVAITLLASAARADQFVVRAATDAVDQPGSRRSVATLQPGTAYTLVKRGGLGGAWCKLNLQPQAGWVLCEAGKSGVSAPPPSTAPPPSDTTHAGAPFDYYVLSLSWSPTFCAEHGRAGGEQCALDRGYGFVVHGLWPQRARGWPESCSTAAGPDEETIRNVMQVMPSRTLIAHEWQKHGTCSGLDARSYFKLLRAAHKAVAIPAQFVRPSAPVAASLRDIKQAFATSNRGLAPEMIAVECRAAVSEVHICLDKDLHFRACGVDVVDRCRGTTQFPAVR